MSNSMYFILATVAFIVGYIVYGGIVAFMALGRKPVAGAPVNC